MIPAKVQAMAAREKVSNAAATLVLFLIIAFGSFALIEFISRSPLWSDVGAAWIQAIGSIAAIIAAVMIMKHQSEDARDLAIATDARSLGRRLAALEALAERGYQMSRSVAIHAKGVSSFFDYLFTLVRPEHIEAITHALKEIPLYTLESEKLVIGIHEMIIGLDSLEPYVLIHSTSNDVHYRFEANDASQVEYICKKIREAFAMVVDGIRDLGHIPVSASLNEEE